MSKGCAFKIETKQLVGGQPMVVVYAVAIEDPVKAEVALKTRTGATADEKVEYFGPISEGTLTDLKVPAGKVVML